MKTPTFDANGYPTQDTLDALQAWPITDAAGALDFLVAAWHRTYGSIHDLSAEEAAVCQARSGDRFLRLATGGWSGNEDLIDALRGGLVWSLTWRLSASGGLVIFGYPPALEK